VPLVIAGTRHRADHAARAPAILRAVRVGDDPELLQGIDAQEHSGNTAWRVVVGVVNIGLVEHKADLVGTPATNRKLDAATRRIGRASGWHYTGLLGSELHDVPAIQRQLPDRILIHHAGEGCTFGLYLRSSGVDDSFRRDRLDLHADVEPCLLPYS